MLSTAVLIPAVGPGWLAPDQILNNAGSWALWITLGIIFAECGLLLGFFLPGDTLLFSVGLFVSQGLIDHSIWLVCVIVAIGAILGNLVGYEIGRAVGPSILQRDSRLLKREHVERTARFFEKYGPRAIVLARFVPVVRTLITVTAGVAKMDRRTYYLFSTIGGAVWVFALTLVGWRLGSVPFVRDHIQPNLELVLLAVVVLSVVPVSFHFAKEALRSSRGDKDDPKGEDHKAPQPSPSSDNPNA